METIETRLTNGFYVKATFVNGVVRRVEVCRRGVILAFADDIQSGIEKAQEIAREKGIRIPIRNFPRRNGRRSARIAKKGGAL